MSKELVGEDECVVYPPFSSFFPHLFLAESNHVGK